MYRCFERHKPPKTFCISFSRRMLSVVTIDRPYRAMTYLVKTAHKFKKLIYSTIVNLNYFHDFENKSSLLSSMIADLIRFCVKLKMDPRWLAIPVLAILKNFHFRLQKIQKWSRLLDHPQN